jgi:DNA processing protein
VPGHIDSCKSEGTHWLLKQGAKLVQSATDIVEELDITGAYGAPEKSGKDQENNVSLEPDAVALLSHLESYPRPREELLEITGFTPARISELLLFLELDGFVEMLPGDKVRKISADL